MGTPHMTAPGASALCAWDTLGCSSGSCEVWRGRTCLPAFGLSWETSPAELPGPCDSGWGTGSSLTRLQTAGHTQPVQGSGLRGAQVSLMVMTTGCDPGSCDASLQWSTGGSAVGRREPACWLNVPVAASPSEPDE